MYQNYFIINGVKYYAGTIFIVKNMGIEEEASFICYDVSRNKYVYKIRDCKYHMDEATFMNRFVRIAHKVNNKICGPIVKTKRDTEIDGLFLGWIWYIFLMMASVIFKDVIWLWILISVVFFSWRFKKIKEEGTYIEW